MKSPNFVSVVRLDTTRSNGQEAKFELCNPQRFREKTIVRLYIDTSDLDLVAALGPEFDADYRLTLSRVPPKKPAKRPAAKKGVRAKKRGG